MKPQTEVLTNREAFLAADPTARKVHDERMKEFRQKFSKLVDGLTGILHGVVAKAEQLRQVGIVMIEWCDESLPGGKFTRDLYEQHKDEFQDVRGQAATFEFLEYAMKVASANTEPIETLHTALKYKQPLLMATGDETFTLESEPPPQRSVQPPDTLHLMKQALEPSYIGQRIEAFRKDSHYYIDGKPRENLRDVMREQWKPTFDALDDFRKDWGL